MKTILSIVGLVVIIGLILFYQPEVAETPVQVDSVEEKSSEARSITGFSWENPVIQEDGVTIKSEVYIVTHYSDETSEKERVDTIEGTCNADPNDERGLICFYAGLLNTFRIVEEGNAYLIQQKTSEEASPYNERDPLPVFETKMTIEK